MRILYVSNDLPSFDAHRRWLMDAARAAGAEVLLACGGVPTEAPVPPDVVLDVERYRFNPRRDYTLGQTIRQVVADAKPDVVHLITIKPILFGSLALLLAQPGPRRVVASFAGLGRVFDEADISRKARLRRALVVQGLKVGFAPDRVRVTVEKDYDRERLLEARIVPPQRVFHISGAGLDPAEFARTPLPGGRLRILFAGRLLKSKGVMEAAGAAARAASKGVDLELVVAGSEQPDDPDGLTADDMATLRANRNVSLLGPLAPDLMPGVIATCHAVVLPSRYSEGVPRILIEAAAMGRALIVSDNPGCTALVDSPAAGLVLKASTPASLAQAYRTLASDPTTLTRLAEGAHSRFVTGGFAREEVSRQMLRLYE